MEPVRSSCRERAGFPGEGRGIGLLLACLIGAGVGPAGAIEIGGSEVDLSLEGQRISIASEAPVPLRGLIEAIGSEAGIEVALSGDLGLVQPISIERSPLDQAIRQLVGDHSLLMIYAPSASGARPGHLTKVVIDAAKPPDERARARAEAQARQRTSTSTSARPLSDDTAGRIRRLAEDGHSPGEISQQINMPVDQVQRHLQALRRQN
jgi:hypothetical protein